MSFKDIVNRNLVNLTNCEQEPIHIPGSIQGFGFLLGLKTFDLTIDFCSGNAFEYSGLTHEQLLGKRFETVFGETQARNLKRYTSNYGKNSVAPLEIKLVNNSFTCAIQAGDNTWLLEFEPVFDLHFKITDIYQQTVQVTNYLQKAGSLRMLCQSVADETRAITGYDRVMIYRFDENYNGEVYAESLNENVDSFFGLHYPQSDIPAQARALFLKNLMRMIVDVNYEPVPIYTIDDLPGKNLDLSLSVLRSSSPIHVQYLKNMGVAASLTISLIYEGKLWGMIACHHNSPKYLSGDIRLAAQLQGHFLTSQIGVRQLAEEYEVSKIVNTALDDILSEVFASNETGTSDIIKHPGLLAITNASSVIIVLDNKIYSAGPVPSSDEIMKLVYWLQTYNQRTGFSIINLSSIYPDAKKWCDLISGIVFYSLGGGANDCIIWCRPEVLQEVYWAGNPGNAVIKTEHGLSPRTSFDRWKEVKKCESTRWLKPELSAATSFANAFQKHVHMMFLSREEQKQRTLSEKLQEANAELENLYWIGSHDLKEPLRKIQLFASRILDDNISGDYDKIITSVVRMNDSAKRMQSLVSDIVSYSRLSHVEEGFTNIDFDVLVKAVINDLKEEINEQHAVLEFKNLPTVQGISFFLQQLLVNLFRNSLKFSKPGLPPLIAISYKGIVQFPNAENVSEDFHQIVITDNGIGFEDQFKDAIFKVFTRLHTQQQYSGTGVGLALCRKIMKNHHGYITAESEPGVGSAFSLFFPVPGAKMTSDPGE